MISEYKIKILIQWFCELIKLLCFISLNKELGKTVYKTQNEIQNQS